jgi:DnaJ-class molecular chaperone
MTHIGCETCDGEGVGEETLGAPWLTREVACPDCYGSGCDPACPDLDSCAHERTVRYPMTKCLDCGGVA